MPLLHAARNNPVAFTLAAPQANGDENLSHGERLAAQATIRRDEFGLDALPMPVSNEVQVRVYVADAVSGLTAQRLSRAD